MTKREAIEYVLSEERALLEVVAQRHREELDEMLEKGGIKAEAGAEYQDALARHEAEIQEVKADFMDVVAYVQALPVRKRTQDAGVEGVKSKQNANKSFGTALPIAI